MEKAGQNILDNNFSYRPNPMGNINQQQQPYAPASNSFGQSM